MEWAKTFSLTVYVPQAKVCSDEGYLPLEVLKSYKEKLGEELMKDTVIKSNKWGELLSGADLNLLLLDFCICKLKISFHYWLTLVSFSVDSGNLTVHQDTSWGSAWYNFSSHYIKNWKVVWSPVRERFISPPCTLYAWTSLKFLYLPWASASWAVQLALKKERSLSE